MNMRPNPETFAAADPDNVTGTKTRNGSLASLKLDWLGQVVSDKGVPDGAVKVAVLIAKHVNERERRAWPRMSTLAGHLGCAERTVRDHVHALIHRQHLGRTKRGFGNLNQYELLLNDLTVEDRGRAEAAAAPSKPASKRPAKADNDPAESGEALSPFECFIAAFPAQDREFDRVWAVRRYEACLCAGVAANTILAGAETYREFCDAHGYTGTPKVYPPAYWLKLNGWLARDPEDLLEGARR